MMQSNEFGLDTANPCKHSKLYPHIFKIIKNKLRKYSQTENIHLFAKISSNSEF